MYDDLVQVIRGAARILNTLLERREKPIYNYVLVPFHDPDIGPVTVTTDPDIFHQQLKDLYVQGGGDCPEMSVGAVKLALEVSLPNSYIYVFTDARSKDYNLLEDVLKLMQKKESQVVFVMTGDCGDQTHPGFQAYERIALSSSGQVFHLKKSDVDEVLNFVQVSLQARKVNLLAVDQDEGNETEFNLDVDSNLREFTLSVAGDNPSVILINPKGEIVDEFNGLNDLLNLNNVLIVNVKDPIPGQWLLKLKSDSRHSIRATGLSGLDFQHGYSREPTTNLEETYHRPLKGAPTYLLLNATDLLEPGRLTKIQLVDLKGNILREALLEKLPGTSTLFTATFIPPDEYFYLKVLGHDERNYSFQRMTAVPISSQLPDIPEVTTRSHLYGYYGKESILRCYVESLVPFSATWHKDNIQISQEHQFPQTTELTLIIPEVTSLSEGYYTCNATNIAGSSSSSTFLDVKEPPPIISKPENMSAIPDKTAILSCAISSTVPYNVTWFRLYMDRAGYFRQKSIKDNLRFKVQENYSLVIHHVANDDEGWYRCIATNEGGFNREQFYFAVQEPPTVTVIPTDPKFTSDDSINITCLVKGYPKPEVQWVWDKKYDRIMQEGRMHLDKTSIIISRTHPDDEGHYQCKATNSAGTDLKSVFLQYIEAPVITLPEKHILIRHGDVATLRCIAEGIPLPRVAWFHGNIEIFPTSYIHQDSSGSLIINGVQETDAGNYTCLAINEAGAAEESLYLDVGSAPVIVHGPIDTSIDIGTSGSIPCSASGLPYPSIIWQKKNGENLMENPRFTIHSSGSLYIHEITKDDEGYYVCIIENRFGRHMLEAFVSVSGIVPPALKDADELAAVKKGETIFLPCEVNQGNPQPIIYWLWNGRIIENEPDIEIYANGSLKIENADDHHQSTFTCVASNIGGNATNTVILDIQEPPTFIGEMKEDYVAVEGQDISLPCSVIGNPKPEITWFKNNIPVFIDDVQFKHLPTNDLYISEVSETDVGLYTCEAINIIGATNQSINLIVHVPPKIKASQTEFTTLKGDLVTLPCETHSIPKADIFWYYNKSHIPNDAQILSNGNLRFKSDLNHAGDYLCQATNIAGTSSKLFTIIVWIPPSINSKDSENITVVEADPLIINCPVNGYPLPSIYWEKDGLPLVENYNIDIKEETLTVISMNINDGGRYSCIAKNNAGTVTKDFSVFVHVPPIINFKSANLVTAVEASDVVLDCKASGIPQPVITWIRNEENASDSNFQPVVAENNSLLLFDVSTEDSGVYICFATNSAGNDSVTIKLNVYVPPKIDKTQVSDNIQVIEGESVTLLCPVSGTPLPLITWYRKNSTLNIPNSRISILKNGQILTINKIREDEADMYTCQAINEAGIEEMNISVQVLVPPKFVIQNHISVLYVIQGDTLTVNCSVIGNPKPKIIWRKDGYPMNAVNINNIQVNTEQIIIKESQISNSGRYSCMAENVAGHISREYQVSVVVPPWLEENAFEKLEVIMSHSAILNCPVGGIPPPVITWMKDNAILRRNGIRAINGGRTLTLSHTELNDGGTYTCIAENTAGEVKKEINLIVLVPPYIKSQQITPIIKTMKSDTINLECEVAGIPFPEVRWMKDDLSINLIYRYPEYEMKGTNLIIANLTESDGGRYTCTAINKAGSSSRDYSVNVMIPPKLMEEKEQQKYEFTSGTSIQLLCPIYGQPFPTITWVKDGSSVEQTSDITLLEKGRILHIYHSSDKNKGHYTCIAENEAGKTEKHYDVDIVVPPHIGEVVDRHNVNEGHEFYLYCPVRGSPMPDIVWLHNGHMIISENNSDIRITENGTLFYIEKVEAKHGGQYTCIATNLAGTADQNFFLDVSVPPSIMQAENLTDEVSAIMNHPVIIKCPASGIPLPSIQWLKNGRPIEQFSDTNIMLSSNKRQLTIKHARKSDASVYKCIAINRAGKTEKEIHLQVLAPPRLLYRNNRGDQAPYEEEESVQVLINETVSLECEVDAVPEPTIFWFKDGILLTTNEEYEMTNRNQILHIDSVEQEHKGHYTCVISNAVGTVEKDFIIDILVPPKIAGPEKVLLEAPIHRPLTVTCETFGNPQPSIMWYKNDYPIDTSNTRVAFSLNNKELHFTHILTEDGGDLICFAENEVGKAKKHFELDVLEPPSIMPSKSQVDTIEGEASSLDCQVIGNPQPTVLWLKDEKFLTVNSSLIQDDIEIYNDGQILLIANTTADHHGKYMCIASNSVGSSEKDFMLNVLVPPKLINDTDSKIVTIGQPVTFNCPITSNPESHITWMKHGRPIDFSNPFIYVMNNGETLKLLRSREVDNGYFSCIARNYVGEVKGTFPLRVLTPSSIDKSNIITSKNAIVNGIITLECPAIGTPLPSIEWLFEDQLISFDDNSRYERLSDGKILRISPVEPSDAGNFKCVAANPVGKDEMEYDLEVFSKNFYFHN
ncbi:hemicentin-1-like isoform X2 [Centruroides sculpturatus]|nr:hemicentin-1-like isoform X2 [Centruroides sculpturatus]XP_023221212.1 hemicentin-1-like isoform X2 [Centruroides sculpturatus]